MSTPKVTKSSFRVILYTYDCIHYTQFKLDLMQIFLTKCDLQFDFSVDPVTFIQGHCRHKW